MASLDIRIVVPEGIKLESTASRVILPGAGGVLSVYPGHISLVTPLTYGSVIIEREQEEDMVLATSGGMCEVEPDGIVLALRTAEHKDEIDVSRAAEAEQRARGRLDSQSGDIDLNRAEAALKRALNRIDVAGKVSKY